MPDYWLYWIGLNSYTEKYIQVFWEVGWEKKSNPPNTCFKNPEIQLEIHFKMPKPQPIKGSTIFGLVIICSYYKISKCNWS